MPVRLLGSIEHYKLDIIEAKVNEICLPLFRGTKISFFEYNKAYLDYSRITLTSNSGWVYNYYNSGYYAEGMHHKNVGQYTKGYNHWNSVGRNKVTNFARNKFEIDNGFTIIEPERNICEFYHFGSMPEEKNMLNFYFNNIKILYRFVSYFKSSAQSLISFASENKILCTQIGTDKPTLSRGKYNYDKIKLMMPVKKFYFYINGTYNYLTYREIEICGWILQGKSAEEISIILGISKRTVETHVEHIKNKLNCYKQTQIITQLISIGLNRIL